MFKDHPITIEEAKEIVKEELAKHKFFPPITDSWDNSRFYFDGLVIEERGSKYVLHEQASGATMNLIFDKEDVFESIDEIIEKYFRSSNMDIDGMKIIE